MKKILTFIMVFALIMSMSVTAFAANEETITNEEDGVVSETLDPNSADINAIGRYDKDGDGVAEGDEEDTETDVIAVDLSWDNMEWIYSVGAYDPDTMTTKDDQWIQAEKTITVSNRSNVGITATPSYAATVADSNLTLGSALNLEAATLGTGGNAGTPAEGTIAVSLDMTAMANVAINVDNTTLGTITVTIAKA